MYTSCFCDTDDKDNRIWDAIGPTYEASEFTQQFSIV